MGKGLSPLQQGILRLALAKRQEFGDHGYGGDASYAELLAYWWQWPLEEDPRYDEQYAQAGEVSSGQHFSRSRIGAAEYNRAMAALSRAVARLAARGVVEKVDGDYVRRAAVRLTPEGLAAAERLPAAAAGEQAKPCFDCGISAVGAAHRHGRRIRRT